MMERAKRRITSCLYLWSMGIAVSGLWTAPSYAEIYKYVKNGVAHYTNLPPVNTTYETFRDSSTSPSVHPKKITQQAPPRKLPYLDLIQKIAEAYQLNPDLLKAIVKVESNYNHQAVSPKGAQGLMQLMPETAKRFGVSDVFDPEENIIGGAKFLRYLFDVFGENNLELVLAGYNAGEEAIRKYGNKIPPYTETRQYIEQVLTHYLPLSKSKYKKTIADTIYRYINKNGVLTFTNVPKVK